MIVSPYLIKLIMLYIILILWIHVSICLYFNPDCYVSQRFRTIEVGGHRVKLQIVS